jgi:hypothetical protein
VGDPLNQIEATHGMDGTAQMLGAYFKALQREGFKRSEAMQLVLSWQAGVLVNAAATAVPPPPEEPS